ncbi:hypothetical protein Cch01nite_26510 [Cellulomonas chitinilytica]|uniref:Uncharacterized protein n=1 Tax=Cellulomonas chitinilytica TaxID=398759 RepID=A0A919P267_9CELL|nr:hypothetical protein [Cellulomonas chitinilytica]GIG21927.1 hypothetical protein Cch01nite_26510 [Cellulomonas chitinilytica]
MTSAVPPPAPELLAIVEECERLGYVHGVDFSVHGVPASFGSELVVLVHGEAGYEVRYRDMGEERVVTAGADLAVARVAFLEEVAWLAAGRGRGPYVGRPSRAEQIAARTTMDEAAAAYYRRIGREPS